jgi:hypothetical protein
MTRQANELKFPFYLLGLFKPRALQISKQVILCFPLSQIVNNPLVLPDELNSQLKELLEGLLCKGE